MAVARRPGSHLPVAELTGRVYEIAEQFAFTATHAFVGASSCHARPSVHLHRWTVEIVLIAARLPPAPRPSELAELDPVRGFVARELDCRHLNSVLTGAPTSGNVALHIADWCLVNLTGFARATMSAVAVSIGSESRARVVIARHGSSGQDG